MQFQKKSFDEIINSIGIRLKKNYIGSIKINSSVNKFFTKFGSFVFDFFHSIGELVFFLFECLKYMFVDKFYSSIFLHHPD